MTSRYKSGHVFEKSGVWYVRYPEAGKRPAARIGTKAQFPTKTAAKKAAAELMRQVNEAATVVFFSHLCEQYVTSGFVDLREYSIAVRKRELKPIREKWSAWRLDELFSSRGILALEEWLKSERVAASTRKKRRVILVLMAKLAVKREWITADQERRVELIKAPNRPEFTKPRRLKVPLTVEQYRGLLSHPKMPPVCKLALRICTETAMRSCEVFGLKRDDIDFRNMKFHIRRSVKGKFIDEPKTPDSRRTEPFDRSMAAALKTWMKANPASNGWLFESPFSKQGTPWNAPGLQRQYLRPIGKRYGIANLGWHTFRHTARAWVKRLGVSIEQQMEFLGHTNPEQTLRYGVDGVDNAERLRSTQNKLLKFARRG